MSLKGDFEEAAENVKNLAATPSDADLLDIYGLYKQATVGDCNTSKPGMFDFRGKAKWDAWNGRKGLTNDTAMKEYITKAKLLTQVLGLKS